MIRLVYSRKNKRRDLDEEALEWVVRLTSGEDGPEDHDAFRRWRDQSQEHLEALDRARILWQNLGSSLPQAEQRARRRQVWQFRLPIAASLALVAYGGTFFWTTGRFDQATPIGEHRVVDLADGSVITMSGDTALDIRMNHDARVIKLARGAIVVHARHNAERPFVVYAGEAKFRDVGTVFEVRRGEEGEQVIVAEGAVEASRGDRRLLVKPAQTITVGALWGQLKFVDAQGALEWTAGRLEVRDKTLPEILEALRPHYTGRIVLIGNVGSHRKLNADIDLDHIDAWLDAMAQKQGISDTRVLGITFLR